jgi:hypothetical protein
MATPAPVPAPVSAPPDPTATIRSNLYAVLVEFAGSTKFQVLLASIVAWIALKLGWHVDQAQIDRLLALVASYLVAQGVTDHGKGKAQVEAKTQLRLATMQHAANANTDANIATVVASAIQAVAAAKRDSQAGLVRLKMMAMLSAFTLGIGIVGASLVSVSGCATVKAMTGAFAGCEKSNLGAVLSSVPTDLASDLTTAGTTPGAGVFANCAALMRANVPALETDLETIAVQVGEVTFGCIWTAIEAVLGPSTDPATKAGLARARVWMAKRTTK